MTGSDGGLQNQRKRDRFIIREGDIEITGHRRPGPEEQDDADRLLNRILKNRKRGRDE